MPPSSLVWKRDVARIRIFLHLSYGRLLGKPPHTSQFTTMEYGGTYRLKQNFILHVNTTFGKDAAHMQSDKSNPICTATAAATLAYKALENTVLKGHCLLLKWIAADLQRTATGQQQTASGLQRTASGLQRIATGQQRTTTGLQRTGTYSLKIVQTAIGFSVSNNSLAV